MFYFSLAVLVISLAVLGYGIYLVKTAETRIKEATEAGSKSISQSMDSLDQKVNNVTIRLGRLFSELEDVISNVHMNEIDSMSGEDFEKYISALLQMKGYRTRVTQGSSDFGIDIVSENESTKEIIQCKRINPEENLSRLAISDAVAGKVKVLREENSEFAELWDNHKTQAVVVTNSSFTPEGYRFAERTNCTIHERDQIESWLQEMSTENRDELINRLMESRKVESSKADAEA